MLPPSISLCVVVPLRMLCALALLAWAAGASADPYTPCGTAPRSGCLAPAPSPGIPSPLSVPGKEHSTATDRHTGNSPPAPAAGCPANPGQNVRWDGAGGTDDSFDYDRETDALGNRGDALALDVIDDTAALLFSVEGSGDIWVEPTAAAGGAAAGAVWASIAPDVEGMCAATDLDGLEVWGADTQAPSDDANRFSRVGDPFNGGFGDRVPVYAHPGEIPLCEWTALAASVAGLLSLSPTQEAFLAANGDLDAMLVFSGPEQAPADSPPPGTAPGIIWSLRPITIPVDGGNPAVPLDGGEIFIGSCFPGFAATYLTHGGHVWDTAFSVTATFGVASENVDALEAVASVAPSVPALSPLGLVLLVATLAASGAAGLALAHRRRAAA